MTADDVLEFWFAGEPAQFREKWFKQDDAFDAAISDRFGLTLEAARDGTLDAWAATPEGALALVIVLDQFSRNAHRGSYLAFAGDAHARAIARKAIAAGQDRPLTSVQRCFLYLPFEHSEDLADQDMAVPLFTSLADDLQMPTMRSSAERHRDVIRRFGRFPHRNAALGRETTPEEAEYLAQPGSGF